MKVKNYLKAAGILTVFSLSYLGVNANLKTRKVANQEVKVTMLSIGSQAKAYCNEARYGGETNNGKCSGIGSDPSSRCTSSASGTACVVE